MLTISEKFSSLFPNDFKACMALNGDIVNQSQNRDTVHIMQQGQSFFIKKHRGVGYWELLINLIQGRRPIVSAKTEWDAIQRVHALNISTMIPVAYGCQGISPANLHSFLITVDLGQHISLEKLALTWKQHNPSLTFKHKLIRQVALLAKKLHQGGVNHRDFYICHILLDLTKDDPFIHPDKINLHLIDLHRAQCRHKVPFRWLVKDIGSLLFSVMDAPLTQNDLIRFIKDYTGMPLRDTLQKDKTFWQAVKNRADALYKEVHGETL